MSKGDTFEAVSDEARLQAQNAELRLRLLEAEETLVAIRQGDVDALVVAEVERGFELPLSSRAKLDVIWVPRAPQRGDLSAQSAGVT